MADPADHRAGHRVSDRPNSGGFAFELMHVAGRRGIDGDSPRLHGFRDFPDQFDLEQSVLERGAVHLNIIGQVKLPLERPRGNAPVEIFAFGPVRLVSLDGHRVLLGRHRDLVGCKARNRKRNLVAILADAFDVVGGIVVLAGTLCRFNEVEKAVETNGRTPQGREVVSAHSQILQGAKWIRTTPDTTGARLSFPTLQASGTPPLGGSGKIKKARFGFKRGAQNFSETLAPPADLARITRSIRGSLRSRHRSRPSSSPCRRHRASARRPRRRAPPPPSTAPPRPSRPDAPASVRRSRTSRPGWRCPCR